MHPIVLHRQAHEAHVAARTTRESFPYQAPHRVAVLLPCRMPAKVHLKYVCVRW